MVNADPTICFRWYPTLHISEMTERKDPYRVAFDRCGGGSTTLTGQQWLVRLDSTWSSAVSHYCREQFLELLADADFLSEELAQRFHQESKEPHSFERFQRDLCDWSSAHEDSRSVNQVMEELHKKESVGSLQQHLHVLIFSVPCRPDSYAKCLKNSNRTKLLTLASCARLWHKKSH